MFAFHLQYNYICHYHLNMRMASLKTHLPVANNPTGGAQVCSPSRIGVYCCVRWQRCGQPDYRTQARRRGVYMLKYINDRLSRMRERNGQCDGNKGPSILIQHCVPQLHLREMYHTKSYALRTPKFRNVFYSPTPHNPAE